jgi:hypothetical protein
VPSWTVTCRATIAQSYHRQQERAPSHPFRSVLPQGELTAVREDIDQCPIPAVKRSECFKTKQLAGQTRAFCQSRALSCLGRTGYTLILASLALSSVATAANKAASGALKVPWTCILNFD